MMWVYEINDRSAIASDLYSLNELKRIKKDAEWVWIDSIEPSSKEFKIVSELFCNDSKILDSIKHEKIFSR